MRVLLYGTGRWAEVHAKAIRGIKDAEIVAVCGHSNLSRLELVANLCEAPVRSMDLRETIENVQPEMIDIVVSPVCRLQAVKESIFPSVKVINIEKPWALWPEDAYEIYRLARENGIKVVVNHQKKCLPSWRSLESLVSDGSLGKVRHIRATCQGNPAEQGTHIVDMALKLAGSRTLSSIVGQVGELEGLIEEHSAPNAAVATIYLPSGITVDLALGACGWEVGLQVLGSEGVAEWGLSKGLRVNYFGDTRSSTDDRGWLSSYLDAERDHLASVISYASGAQPDHDSDVSNGLVAFNVIMATYESALNGGVVSMPRRFTNGLIEELRSRRPSSLRIEEPSLAVARVDTRERWFPANLT
jgi:predicted dehydrogenase